MPAGLLDDALARIDEDEREAVHRLCVVTSSVDRRTLEVLVPGGMRVLTGAEARGLVSVAPDRVGFRHELTRRAVHDALPVAQRAARSPAANAAYSACACSTLRSLIGQQSLQPAAAERQTLVEVAGPAQPASLSPASTSVSIPLSGAASESVSE